MMKPTRLIGTLIMILVVTVFTSTARAAQPRYSSVGENAQPVGGTVYQYYYTSTLTEVYSTNGWEYTFTADGVTNYPYEPYLPNENSPADYRIHSNYTKDTDACASCHATHTAVGSGLLQWYSTYETCMACHDGTVTTTYNVVTGTLPDGSLAPAGMFGMGDEVSLSTHNVTGAVDHSAAPGGSTVPETAVIGGEQQVVRWGIKFGCESCHNPHGLGGNARLLNPDPNGVQVVRRDTEFTGYPLTEISGSPVTYAAYPKDANGQPDTTQMPYYILKTYPYDPVIVVDGAEDQGATIDNSPGYSIITTGRTVKSSIYATFTPALRVRMNVDNYLDANVTDAVYEQVDYLEGMNDFCGACHTDYNTNSSEPSGTYSEAYRHPVGQYYSDWQSAENLEFQETGIVMCTTCHVAHGTSQDYWLRSLASEGYTKQDAVELVGSSALKRKPNMAVCVTCHQPGTEGFAHEDSVYDSVYATYSQEGASYIGSDQCVDCHQRYAGWKQTLHYTGLSAGTGGMLPSAGEFDSHFSGLGKTTADVVYTIGNKWRQNYLVWDSTSSYLQVLPDDWVVGITATDPDQWPAQNSGWMYGEDTTNWQERAFADICAGCHTTGFAADTGSWQENGVACESCHGPGSNHRNTPVDQNITNPVKLSILLQNDVCGSCHARGRNVNSTYESRVSGNNNNYPRYDALGFKPGVSLSVYYDVVTAMEDGTNTYYYASQIDSIKDSKAPHQQYNDYIQSKHFEKGILSCISCHSSHGVNSEGVQLKRTAGQICSACHDTVMDLDRYMPRVTDNGIKNSRTHTFTTKHPDSGLVQ